MELERSVDTLRFRWQGGDGLDERGCCGVEGCVHTVRLFAGYSTVELVDGMLRERVAQVWVAP